MEFSVIYSVDVPRDVSIVQYQPPRSQLRNHWQLTEGDESYEYGYLDGDWAKGKHRKYVAALPAAHFVQFLESQSFTGSLENTMGMIGAPGAPGAPGAEPFYAMMPAFALNGDDPQAIQSAYFCPLATREEIIRFIASQGVDVPQALSDMPGQLRLWESDEAAERNDWRRIETAIKASLEQWIADGCDLDVLN